VSTLLFLVNKSAALLFLANKSLNTSIFSE